jgi:hypothetical protein
LPSDAFSLDPAPETNGKLLMFLDITAFNENDRCPRPKLLVV